MQKRRPRPPGTPSWKRWRIITPAEYAAIRIQVDIDRLRRQLGRPVVQP